MKVVITSLLIGAVCIAVTATVMEKRAVEREHQAIARAQAEWATEKSQLDAALKKAKGKTVVVESPAPAAPAPAIVTVTAKPDPREIIERLKHFKFLAATGQGPNPGQTHTVKRLVHEFESLVDTGESALPAIRAFLDRKGPRDGNVQTDFLVPPTLRLGLFDALRQIGGAQAEGILADALKTTARGLEVAYLARVLQEMAPNKYRDAAIAAVKELLANPVAEAAALDKNDRNYLYGVLAFFNDASYATVAQGQLLAGDGRVDKAALKYLQQTLGDQSVSIVAQAYQDPRVTAATNREPLARVALAFVGANAQAEQMFGQAVRDPALHGNPIRNLVEDLNQDGISNRKVPTPEDLKLIASRYDLTQQYLQQDFVQADKVLLGAFKEANKDLANMLQRAAKPKTAP
ncbi:MAG: hypothetical protein HY300_02990 [Verrucomicrobia bacterium]|nr:hypothetical protein [Verrucomicrobiota bacterium]